MVNMEMQGDSCLLDMAFGVAAEDLGLAVSKVLGVGNVVWERVFDFVKAMGSFVVIVLLTERLATSAM